MKVIIFFFLIYSLNAIIITANNIKPLIIENVTDGIYNIIIKKKNKCLSYNGALKTSKDNFGNSLLSFRISEVKQENRQNEDINKSQYINNTINSTKDNNINKNKFFTIRHLHTRFYLGVKEGKNKNNNLFATDTIISNDLLAYQWEFIKADEKTYLIRNKKGCYLKEQINIFSCLEHIDNHRHNIEFHLLKLYSEVSHTKEDLEILEKEPIDVVIKYIDLSDKNLVREGIPQIKKDEDNEELRYSIRSILKNIPWVRKIFILMPNEKVRYFKDYEFIKEKIVYVKDKDILGYDSANSHAFQFRLWKLKEFGISDNFIIMDDDCFIGKPLNKSQFFYVENNKVVPAIINTNYEVQTKLSATKELNNRKKNIEKSKRTHTSDCFMYTVHLTYIFLIEYFNSPIIVPYFTHNAIPGNANDLKELYDLIDKSKHRDPTLNALYRHIETLQFQTGLIVYTFNKYHRKSNMIDYGYIDNAKTINNDYNYSLFCINTGNNNDYSNISFYKTKIVMEKLYPFPTEYEIYDSKVISNSAFTVIKQLDQNLDKLKKQKILEEIDKEKFENEKISWEYEKCNNQVEMLEAENAAYIQKYEKRKAQLEDCQKTCVNLEAKQNELKVNNSNYIIREQLKQELEKIKIDNDYYIEQKVILKYEKDKYLKQIEKLKDKDKEIYFLIYFQLTFIIIFAVILGIIYPLSKKCKNCKYNNDSNIRLGNKENLRIFDEMEAKLIK